MSEINKNPFRIVGRTTSSPRINYTAEQLTAIGGKEWKKYQKHRVYFNSPMINDLYGILFTTRDFQRIENATVENEPISRDEALHIWLNVSNGKIWYDLEINEFCWVGDNRIFKKIQNNLEILLEKEMKNNDSSLSAH